MLSKTDLKQIDAVVSKRINLETRKIVKEELTPLKKDVSKIRKGMNEIIGFFDTEYMELRKRVERIEDHLSLPPVSN